MAGSGTERAPGGASLGGDAGRPAGPLPGGDESSPSRAAVAAIEADAPAERLVLSHFCIRHAGFEERVAAAAAAGLPEIGLLHRAYDELRAGGAEPAELREVLTRHGVALGEIEVLRPWAAGERQRAAAAAAEATVLEMADVFSARYLQVIGPYVGDLDDAAGVLAGLCDRVAEVGLVVGVEFLPFTNIGDAGVALDLVQRAGRPNAGVCVDAWHHFRGANDWALLEALPAERIVAVQLNDGARRAEDPDYLADCLMNRRVPGEGEFDLGRFVALLRRKGVAVPFSLEVISTALDALPPAEAVRRIAAGGRALLGAPAG